MSQLTFNLESFKGPLDLLLVLIKKNKVNIYDIPISEILEQYLAVMAEMKEMDLEVSSEFLVLAATLLQIKSKMLLPSENEEEEEDPRDELVRRLVEYKMFKEKSEYFRKHENSGYMRFFKLPDAIEAPLPEYDYSNLDGQALFSAYKVSLLKLERKLPPPKKSFSGIVGRERASVREKVKRIWHRLLKRSKMLFSDIFTESKTRAEAVASFMAVLELIKLKKIIVEGDSKDCMVTITDNTEKFSLEGIED